MQIPELIYSGAQFSQLSGDCSKVFDLEARLPRLTFNPPINTFYVFEHGQMFSQTFAQFLANLSRDFADKTVNYMTLVPDPVEYYLKNCGFYGAAIIDVVSIVDRYLKVMARNGEADSFRARGGDIGLLWGGSKEWGIYCDRISWEICILGVSREVEESIVDSVGSMDVADLWQYLAGQYRHNPQKVNGFMNTFIETFKHIKGVGMEATGSLL